MVRKTIQLVVLALLFVLLAGGGNATVCDVLSFAGLDPHHHVHPESGEGCPSDPVSPICLQSDVDHEQENEKVPCPESCEIQISEAQAPLLIKLPELSATEITPFLAALPDAALLRGSVLQIAESSDPPNGARPSIDPTFTGRFLV